MEELTPQDAVQTPTASSTPAELEDARNGQIDRVIDVPLHVTLRFGERRMRLHEVLELNTGSLVELDRQVEEPVDLMLGERVIARGEVVIVDGNYGLRVVEVVERVPASAAA
ncbi:MAG: flagellar motor switch protein FliN [Janthinobacterium lividum]